MVKDICGYKQREQVLILVKNFLLVKFSAILYAHVHAHVHAHLASSSRHMTFMHRIYSGTSDKGLSLLRTQCKKPLH